MDKLRLNKKAFEFAKKQIQLNNVDKSNESWDIDEPGPGYKEQYLSDHGIEQYSNWFLAINENENESSKARFEFPIGNFQEIFRNGIVAAEKRAAQYHHSEILKAAQELLMLIDKKV